MSILVKTRRASDFNLSEREWLRRIRGTTLANLADAANQIAQRRGFVTVSKSFFYEQDRTDKSHGGGYVYHNWDEIENAGSDSYYVDIIHTHPSAEEVGLILTYLAPPFVQLSGTSYTPHLKIRLENSSGTIIDPSSGSGYAVELTHANGGIPAGSFIVNESNFFETSDGALNYNLGHPLYSARIVRTICYLDQGTNPDTTPRRLKYGTAAGTSQHLIVRIDTLNALMLNATVFEIPKITT
jgi:hypothetical protein